MGILLRNELNLAGRAARQRQMPADFVSGSIVSGNHHIVRAGQHASQALCVMFVFWEGGTRLVRSRNRCRTEVAETGLTEEVVRKQDYPICLAELTLSGCAYRSADLRILRGIEPVTRMCTGEMHLRSSFLPVARAGLSLTRSVLQH